MAESAYPKAGSPLLESEWSRIFGSFTGIILGGTVTAAGTGLNVSLEPTTASVRGHGYRDPASKNLAVVAGESQARIDTAVLELDYTKTPIIQAKVIKGAAGAGVPPTLTQTESGVYQHPLADIAVTANAVSIPSGAVTARFTGLGRMPQTWTTVGRPVNPEPNKSLGYNSTLGRWEWWNGTTWVDLAPTSASSLTTGTLNPDRLPVVPVTKGGTGGTSKTDARTGIGIFVQSTQPSAPATNDIWLW